jgi:enterobactin synthetase component D
MVCLSPFQTHFLNDYLSFKLCEFHWDPWDQTIFDSLNSIMPFDVKQAVPKRRAEFVAGRLLAQALLRERGCYEEVRTIEGRRDPLWPDGYVGSITHSRNRAACMLFSEHESLGVGLDLEHWITDEVSADIGSMIFESQKEEDVLRSFSESFLRRLTLAFSAKESLFKALYPFVQTYWEFHDVKLKALEGDSHTGRILAYLSDPIFSIPQTFWVYYRAYDAWVITGLSVTDSLVGLKKTARSEQG